jgi:peptide/nickel transport system substrate-binding protein
MKAFLAALLAAALALAGCGGGSDSGGDGQSTTPGTKGGSVTLLQPTDVDYLDPGHTYYTPGYMVAYATQRPLYSPKPGEAEPVPDLAAGPPEISDGGRTITVKLREGVKFGPPVNREVTSKDVKYALERFFTTNVGGQYTPYFADIEGAPAKLGRYKPISGIQTPDDHTLVLKLARPTGPLVAAALVMPATAPVPPEYAKPFDAKHPSTYDSHVVATGPYMVGEYKPGRLIKLVRNPSWDAKTDDKPAFLNSIVIRTDAGDTGAAAKRALTGSHLLAGGGLQASVAATLVPQYRGQSATLPLGGTRWFPLNTTVKPFDDVNVRKAVLAGFDRDAVRAARGGRFAGQMPTHFLPPGIAGFAEAGGDEGPGVDFLSHPGGDAALSSSYFKKAGYKSGRYVGTQTFTLVTADRGAAKRQAEVAAAQFRRMGFRVRLRTVPADAVYTEYCQRPDLKLFSCGAAGWFKDFVDPQAMLEPTFKGSAIHLEGGNNNLSQLDDPKINAAMDDAATKTGDERLKAWADVDRMVTEQAPAVPFLWDTTTVVASKDVRGVGNPFYGNWDLTRTSIR